MNTIVGADRRDYLRWRHGSGRTVELYDIQVGSERRAGIGRKLVEQLFRELPADTLLVWAITRSTNLIAQEFYEALGFRVVAVLRNFYQDQGMPPCADAIMFGKDFIPE